MAGAEDVAGILVRILDLLRRQVEREAAADLRRIVIGLVFLVVGISTALLSVVFLEVAASMLLVQLDVLTPTGAFLVLGLVNLVAGVVCALVAWMLLRRQVLKQTRAYAAEVLAAPR